MIRLIQLELQKLWLNRTSKVLIFISFVLPLFLILLSSFEINFFGIFVLKLGEVGLFNFPLIWHVIPFFASYFKFFFAIVVVSMIGNEYSNKTLKQNLIDGLSKKEFILSKFCTIVFFALISSLIILIMGLCIGYYYSSYTEFAIVTRELEFIFAYFLKLVGFFSLCLFLGMITKRSAFALAFLFVLFLLEWIVYGIIWKFSTEEFATSIQNFFPLKSIYKLIDWPFVRIAASKMPDNPELVHDYAVHFSEIAIVMGWTSLFVFLSYRLLKKRDL